MSKSVRFVRIFWPVVLYLVSFLVYSLWVNDFYSGRNGISRDSELMMVLMISSAYLFPGLGVMQLIYGLMQWLRKRGKNYKLHIYSAIAMLGIFGLFVLSLSFGNYPTV